MIHSGVEAQTQEVEYMNVHKSDLWAALERHNIVDYFSFYYTASGLLIALVDMHDGVARGSRILFQVDTLDVGSILPMRPSGGYVFLFSFVAAR